ncbi:hypothetical protein AVEN_258775-1 [Araneus ventricosus]|uniref:Transposon Ty3-I Gag-Pol polyprotein n=1 Tax=Araneus ventricosus TaxID=182803 RepID=A0A4Y2D246_ARAVE|nr:hypothetical protein AVEN_258775-1 [Araneus ventricosus]
MIYKEIFKDYPELLQLIPNFKKTVSHNTVHFLETTDLPLFSKLQRLHPKVLNEVKKEFQYLIDQGICRPSKSPWASPIYVVPKADGSYRVCGDYRRLNSVTVADGYPVPHIHDVINILHGIKPLKSKVEVIQNYPRPKTVSELRRYIGLINYFRRFNRNAILLAPLTDQIRGAEKERKHSY